MKHSGQSRWTAIPFSARTSTPSAMSRPPRADAVALHERCASREPSTETGPARRSRAYRHRGVHAAEIGTVACPRQRLWRAAIPIDIYKTSFRPLKHTLSAGSERSMM